MFKNFTIEQQNKITSLTLGNKKGFETSGPCDHIALEAVEAATIFMLKCSRYPLQLDCTFEQLEDQARNDLDESDMKNLPNALEETYANVHKSIRKYITNLLPND